MAGYKGKMTAITEGKDPLPYTFADLQHKIEEMLADGMAPEAVFEVMQHTNFIAFLNYTIYRAAEKK